MTEKHLFLSDLDGTLLDDKKRVTPATASALSRFVEGGGHFAICTGRDINSARSVYKGLGFNFRGSYVVAYNGGQIYDVDGGETIFRIGIEPWLVKELFEQAKAHGVYIHTYNDDFILTQQNGECIEYYRRVIKTPVILADDVMPYVNVPPCKMISIELHDHAKQDEFAEAMREKYGDILDIMYSNDYYLEFIPRESGKGSALIRLAEKLGIDRKNTLAAGDAENDISMIEAAGLGIAMCNAAEVVKKAADIVTETDNNHDGLAPVLERFV